MEIVVAVLVIIIIVLAVVIWRQFESLQTESQFATTAAASVVTPSTEPTPEIANLNTEVIGLRRDMAKADEIILKLRRGIGERDTKVDELQAHLDDNANLINNLRGQITTSELGSVESRALYATVSAVAFDSVLVLNEEGIIIATNRSGDSLFGNTNPIGETLEQALASDALADLIARTRDNDEELEEQFALNASYYRARAKVLRYDSAHAFTGVALQDITQLVRLNRARRDMVANISHELRTPIANIRMIIEGLFYAAERPKRKASISTLRTIMRETDSLLWLVQELLDLSMIESGQAIMKLLPSSLLELLNDTTERLKDQLGRKELKLVVHVPSRMQILCDYEQTRRVLINLIHNAIKWSPEKGAITISASYQDDEVLVSIFDNGSGVPDNQRERIFERFYQVDTARSGSQGGSGLGLAICKHIVEAHGGRIWAEGNSMAGGGRFFFTMLASDENDRKSSSEMARGQHDFLPLPNLPTPVLLDEVDDETTIELVDDDVTSVN